MPETNGMSGTHLWENFESVDAVAFVDVDVRETRRFVDEDDDVVVVVVAVMDELVRSLLLLSCWSTSTRMRLLGSRFLARKRGRFIESRRKEREIFVFVFFFSKEKIKCTRYYYEKTDWIYGPDDEWTSPHIYIYMYMCIYISFLRLQATKSFTWW